MFFFFIKKFHFLIKKKNKSSFGVFSFGYLIFYFVPNINGFQILNINFLHLVENVNLDSHHRDPFDRLIIAQAIIEDMSIIGRDVIFDNYLKGKNVKRVW